MFAIKRMGWKTGVSFGVCGGRRTAGGGRMVQKGWLAGWFEMDAMPWVVDWWWWTGGWMDGIRPPRRLFGLRTCQVVRRGWDGPGRRRAEEGKRDNGITLHSTTEETSSKLSKRDGSTLMKTTISLLLGFFVGGDGSLTTKEGWNWLGVGRVKVPGYIFLFSAVRSTTMPWYCGIPSHDGHMASGRTATVFLIVQLIPSLTVTYNLFGRMNTVKIVCICRLCLVVFLDAGTLLWRALVP